MKSKFIGCQALQTLPIKEDKDVAQYESIRDQMIMPREFFGLSSNIHLSNNSHTTGMLERRLSDWNYNKMTKSTKSNKLTNMTKNDIIVKVQTAPQYYEDDIHSFEARDAIFEDPNPVVVANE